jgi:hypothetical protein
MGISTPPARDEQRDSSPDSPRAAIYRIRCDRFAKERDDLTRRWGRIANVRLVVFLAALACFGLGLFGRAPLLGLVGIGGFIAYFVLARRHTRIGAARYRAAGMWNINDEAGKRIARRWHSLPLRHTTRAEPGHPYANDLDIFGHASLFHLLDKVNTRMGEATLSHWLLQPAGPETVQWRQAAVAELAPMLDFRDELALRGGALMEAKPDPEPLLAWAEGRPMLPGRRAAVWAARLSPVFLGTFLIANVRDVIDYPIWLVFLALNLALWYTVGRPAYTIISDVRLRGDALLHFAASLHLISSEDFRSPAMRHLKAELLTDGQTADVQIARLHRLASLMIPQSAMLYAVFQMVTLWDIHVLALLESWQAHTGKHIRGWLTALGGAEAIASLAGLAYDNPDWTFPQVDADATTLEARGLGHPLLPDSVRVDNDVTVGPAGTFLLVTGSNMSGKSTLLRAIGVNAVLANAGGPVCASWYQSPPVHLWTSMRVQDSLEQGVSYFMAELQRLKAIVDAANANRATRDGAFLYLLDEILQGTNTSERQIAARRIIAHLIAQGAIGAVSTHDLTIAEAEELATAAHAVHFTEQIRATASGPSMTFDYKLRPGIATSTNALRLMQIVGLDLKG